VKLCVGFVPLFVIVDYSTKAHEAAQSCTKGKKQTVLQVQEFINYYSRFI
jgi:hypothetical protein